MKATNKKEMVRRGKKSTRQMMKVDNRYQSQFWLNNLPYVVLCHLSSVLVGYDAISFGECVMRESTASERKFWRTLGKHKLEKIRVDFPQPANGYVSTDDYFYHAISARQYCRFIYNGFCCERFMQLMNCYNSNSFKVYSRLIPYSPHPTCYNLPVFVFFDVSDAYGYRELNLIENQLFRVCRNGNVQERFGVVNNMQEFLFNLNNRFFFYLIKKWINFSMFMMAGGAVLNCLLTEGFNSSLQDMDFFWKGGSFTLFVNAINRFKRSARSRILEEKEKHRFLVEFILFVDTEHRMKIQFIFGREINNVSFILNTFDLDIVQVGFDGSKVLSTLGFCQAIATQTFICYKLSNHIRDAPYFLDRCLKYNQRGFTWLCPIRFDDFVAQKPLVYKEEIIDYGFQDFYFNTDTYNLQHEFLSLDIFK